MQFLGVFLVSGLCVLQARDDVLLREHGEIQLLLRVGRVLVLDSTSNFRCLPLERRVMLPDEVELLSLRDCALSLSGPRSGRRLHDLVDV